MVNDDANDTSPFVIAADGDVGIGGVPGDEGKLWVETDGDGMAIWTTTGTITTSLYNGLGAGRFGTELAHPLVFYTEGADRVTITTSGNVGIGTDNPDYKLDVVDNATTDDTIRVANSGVSNNASIGFQPSTQFWSAGAAGSSGGPGGTSANSFFIQQGGAGPRLTIDTDGNVGIGTVNPMHR